jgi:hypothetical protein
MEWCGSLSAPLHADLYLLVFGFIYDFTRFDPWHHATQFSAHYLNGVVCATCTQLRKNFAALCIVCKKLFHKLSGLNFFQDLFHFGLGLFVHHARTSGQITEFSGIGN